MARLARLYTTGKYDLFSSKLKHFVMQTRHGTQHRKDNKILKT